MTVLPNTSLIELLNQAFQPLTPIERLQRLYHYFRRDQVLVTSSFGSQSALLLYWLSNLQPEQSIHFLDTGYHFEETLAYKAKLTEAFDLRVVTIQPDAKVHQQSRDQALWQHQPNKCCFVNKVQPLEQTKLGHELWISGLMRYQTPHRQELEIFEQRDNLIKFYPLIDLTEAEFEAAFEGAALPRHPLQALGYHSIGCWHCTKRGKGRSGRWAGIEKTECGLHFG